MTRSSASSARSPAWLFLAASVAWGVPYLLAKLAPADSYAGGTLFYKRHFFAEPPLGVLAAALLACVVVTTVPAAVTAPSSMPSAQALACVAVLGIGCTGGGYLAFYALITRIGSGRAAVITYVAPAIAVVGGVVVLGEPLTAGVVAGLLLVLAGSWLATGGRPPSLGRASPTWSQPTGRAAQ